MPGTSSYLTGRVQSQPAAPATSRARQPTARGDPPAVNPSRRRKDLLLPSCSSPAHPIPDEGLAKARPCGRADFAFRCRRPQHAAADGSAAAPAKSPRAPRSAAAQSRPLYALSDAELCRELERIGGSSRPNTSRRTPLHPTALPASSRQSVLHSSAGPSVGPAPPTPRGVRPEPEPEPEPKEKEKEKETRVEARRRSSPRCRAATPSRRRAGEGSRVGSTARGTHPPYPLSLGERLEELKRKREQLAAQS